MHASSSSFLHTDIKPRSFSSPSSSPQPSRNDSCTPFHLSIIDSDTVCLDNISPSSPPLDAHILSPPPSPRTCLCSPTNHAGSFRCRLHRAAQKQWPHPPARRSQMPCADDDDCFNSAKVTAPAVKVPPLLTVSPRGIVKNVRNTSLCSGVSLKSPVSASRLSKVVSAEDFADQLNGAKAA